MSAQWIKGVSKKYVFHSLLTFVVSLTISSVCLAQGKKYSETEDLDTVEAPKKPKVVAEPIVSEPVYVLEARRSSQKKDYKKVIELLWPKMSELSVKAQILLASAYAEEKKWGDVLKVCKIGLAQNPKNSDLLTLQGWAQFELGKEKIALEDLKYALELDPKNEMAYEKIAKIYEKRKNYYELRTIYQDMIEKIGQKPKYYAALCKVDTMDIANESAIKNCSEALRRNPDDIESTVNLGTVYSHTGQSKEAEKMLKKVSTAHPNSEPAQQSTGQYYEGKNNFSIAIPYYERCLKVNPVSEPCLIGASQSQLQVQKFEDAHKNILKLCNINRKYAVNARKAVTLLRSFKNDAWEKRFADLAADCSL